jgi:hypothetical protein
MATPRAAAIAAAGAAARTAHRGRATRLADVARLLECPGQRLAVQRVRRDLARCYRTPGGGEAAISRAGPALGAAEYALRATHRRLVSESARRAAPGPRTPDDDPITALFGGALPQPVARRRRKKKKSPRAEALEPLTAAELAVAEAARAPLPPGRTIPPAETLERVRALLAQCEEINAALSEEGWIAGGIAASTAGPVLGPSGIASRAAASAELLQVAAPVPEGCAPPGVADLDAALARAAGRRGGGATTCDECGDALEDNRELFALVCAGCGAVRSRSGELALGNELVPAQNPPPNPRGETDYKRSAQLCLRRLQGLAPVSMSLEDLERVRRVSFRDRRSWRNVSVGWYRVVLQELQLTRYNEEIPALMRRVQRVAIPTLAPEEELAIAGDMVLDNASYLFLKSRGSGEGRRNALAYPYNAYRQIDRRFPPGDSRRFLLRLIWLQEQDTLRSHEDDFYEICQLTGRPFYKLGAPPEAPFPRAEESSVF